MEKIFYVEGVDKTLDVYESKVVLTDRKVRGIVYWALLIGLTISTLIGGLIFYFIWNAGNGKEKTIYIKNLKSIELKKPDALTNGVMQFNLDDSANRENTFGGENSITFRGKDNYETCVAIRDYIEEKIA